MRFSFKIDPELMDMIDDYAHENHIDRNAAIQKLVETGFSNTDVGAELLEKHRSRTYEEIEEILADIRSIKETMSDLRDEVRLIHHIIDTDWTKEAEGVPYQGKKTWEVWKK